MREPWRRVLHWRRFPWLLAVAPLAWRLFDAARPSTRGPTPRGFRSAEFALPGVDVATLRDGFLAFFQEDAARRYDPPGRVKLSREGGGVTRLE